MIDFKKFEMAYELIQKLPNHDLSFHFGEFILWNEEDEPEDFYCLDALISKLEELILKDKTKPKYEVGQEVWCLEMGIAIDSFKIEQIHLNHSNEWEYDNFPEGDIYPSREALIDDQIDFWNELRCPSISESTLQSQANGLKLAEKIVADSKRINEITDKMVKQFPCVSIAQLDMLDNLRKMPTPKESDCKHVSDGMVYLVNSILDDDGLSRCKECGEFYK